MLLDKGGAERRRRPGDHATSWKSQPVDLNSLPGYTVDSGFNYHPLPREEPEDSVDGPTVRITVTETHDGVPCDCINDEAKEMVFHVGDEIVLTHTCHDGRVDKVIARIESVDATVKVPVEHATVSRRGPQDDVIQ